MRKKILRYKIFSEKKLELSDLKDSTARGNTLVKKLKGQEDVALDSGSVVKIKSMMDPDIDGDWVSPSDGVENITDETGEFDFAKASGYFKNVKPKDQRKNSYRANTYVPVLMGNDGKLYSLTDLKKDISFGSTGAGVKIREHESIQMIFLALRLHMNSNFPSPEINKPGKGKYSYPKIEEILVSLIGRTDFKFGNIVAEPAPGFVLTEEMANYYSADQSWLSTFSNVPNKLVNQYDSEGNKVLGKTLAYTIYHVASKAADSVPNAIFERFKAISKTRKNEGVEGEPAYKSKYPQPDPTLRYGQPFDRASGSEIEFSKYCPADIYVVETKENSNLIAGIKSCTDILELNTFLNSCFNDRKIIPISLKRVGPSPKSATLIVNAEAGTEAPDFDVTSFRLSADAEKGIASKIMTMSTWMYKKRKIERERNLTMDSPNTRKNSNIDAEIDGAWARHGKISLMWIKKFIEASDIYQKLSERLDLKIMEWKELQSKDLDQLREILADLRKQIDDLRSEIDIEVKYDLKGRDIAGAEKKMISKIQSLQVIRTLAVIDKFDEGGNEVDDIVTKMLLYALSIQNPGFSSPKYVRVI